MIYVFSYEYNHHQVGPSGETTIERDTVSGKAVLSERARLHAKSGEGELPGCTEAGRGLFKWMSVF